MARDIVAFVEQHNVASVEGRRKAGFAPYAERRDVQMLFHLGRGLKPLAGRLPDAL